MGRERAYLVAPIIRNVKFKPASRFPPVDEAP